MKQQEEGLVVPQSYEEHIRPSYLKNTKWALSSKQARAFFELILKFAVGKLGEMIKPPEGKTRSLVWDEVHERWRGKR
ncbi:hypothetical protein CW304_28825 [Bacillus sp. UFRGS-B20]|nr:hypothetical protein CW304_28825 [Bacillus sp. UFRGS-B20]